MIKFILAFFAALILISCSADQQKTSAVVSDETYPDQESWDATVVITREGKTIGLIKAGHVKKFSKKKETHLLEGISVDFFNNEGEHTSVLTSEGGKIFDLKQDMIAFGNVLVVSDSGITLFTDTLKWDNKNQKIISEIPVKIISEEADTLYGDSFISDPDLETYEIINPHGRSSKTINFE